jgi:hypothetical protein
MKTFILFGVLMIVHVRAKSQAQSVDSLFIVTYTTGPLWDASKKPAEQTYFKQHSGNLSSLRKAGVIQFGARYAEKGIIILKASTMNAAKDLIYADAAVANKLFTADVQKLNVFYEGCVQK